MQTIFSDEPKISAGWKDEKQYPTSVCRAPVGLCQFVNNHFRGCSIEFKDIQNRNSRSRKVKFRRKILSKLFNKSERSGKYVFAQKIRHSFYFLLYNTVFTIYRVCFALSTGVQLTLCLNSTCFTIFPTFGSFLLLISIKVANLHIH